MKVKWLCVDGKKDVGWYDSKKNEFLTFDPVTISDITHWVPLPELSVK